MRARISPLLTLAAGAFAITACGLAQAAVAQGQYPDRPVHLVVPFPAGGGADYWGRLVAGELAKNLGQPVVVDNIPGNGGNNGTAVAARARADGYTLLLGSTGPLAVHPSTYVSLPFEPKRDFVPVALLESSPIVLVASSSVPVSSARELIELARAKPGSLAYASNGDGSPEQVAGEIFKARLKLDIRHIPFDGAGPARKAVLAGQAGLMFDPCKGALPAILRGAQKPVAVAADHRLADLPQTPTFAEIGVPDYKLRIWTGVLAPAGTPDAIIARLNGAVRAIVQSPQIKRAIATEGGEAGGRTPEHFAHFLSSERQHWGALVRETHLPKVTGPLSTQSHS
ncbi:MAG: tripartite tricarboxylate transporter substrate binding protein [Proteobacteria bacterium]|nr:tripartite tricarboxylate transporter substrate binding protein [Pseudomonadota bacterium]